jgi:hypothetical protein
MWNEWLARTLRPRPAQPAALARAPQRVADESNVETVRPSIPAPAHATRMRRCS